MSSEFEHLAGLLTGRHLVGAVLAYSVFPYALLWVAVRCWPKGDSRRSSYLGEYEHVDWWFRPIWVGDVAVRSVLDGMGLRAERRYQSRTERLAAAVPREWEPSTNWFRGPVGPAPPLCFWPGLPWVVLLVHLYDVPFLASFAVGVVGGAANLLAFSVILNWRRKLVWRRANERLERWAAAARPGDQAKAR